MCQNQILSSKYPLRIRIGKKQPVNWMTWWYAHEQYVDDAYILFLFLEPDRTKWIFRKYKMALISIISTVVLIYRNITWLLFVTYRFAFWKISNHVFSLVPSEWSLRCSSITTRRSMQQKFCRQVNTVKKAKWNNVNVYKRAHHYYMWFIFIYLTRWTSILKTVLKSK